jgi:hypothetical protein
MRRQSGIFAWQDPPLVGHKLTEKVNVLKIERISREIDFGFRSWGAHFDNRTSGAAGSAPVGFVRTSFAWHKEWLLNFAVKSMAAKRRVILLQLQLFGLELFVASGCITRRGFSFFARFCAFDGYDFAGHFKLFLFLRLFLGLFLFALTFSNSNGVDSA